MITYPCFNRNHRVVYIHMCCKYNTGKERDKQSHIEREGTIETYLDAGDTVNHLIIYNINIFGTLGTMISVISYVEKPGRLLFMSDSIAQAQFHLDLIILESTAMIQIASPHTLICDILLLQPSRMSWYIL